MRILDENGQELAPEDVDLGRGFLKTEEILIEEIPEQSHYFVKQFFFDDWTTYTPTGEDDPHVKIVDAATGKFEFVPQEGEDSKTLSGMDIGLVIDQPYEERYETIQRYIRYSDYEIAQRALPQRMTDMEDAARELSKTIAATNQSLTETNSNLNQTQTRLSDAESHLENTDAALTSTNETLEDAQNNLVDVKDNLDEVNVNMEDLILLMAEVLGGAEEVPEEESEEEIPEEVPEEEEVPAEVPEETPIEENPEQQPQEEIPEEVTEE